MSRTTKIGRQITPLRGTGTARLPARMQNAECKMQNDRGRAGAILHSAFCILHSTHLSPREITISSNVSRYSFGVSRIAAPVGQLRTHAGPPLISRQRSHFTATVCSASLSFSLRNSDATHVKSDFF